MSVLFFSGPLVLCYGICERWRPDVPDTTIAQIWRSPFAVLCCWSDLSPHVLAPKWGHLQVISLQVQRSSTIWALFGSNLQTSSVCLTDRHSIIVKQPKEWNIFKHLSQNIIVRDKRHISKLGKFEPDNFWTEN